MTKRYSLRKLRTGKLVLALVGSFIAVGAASTQQLTIHAQEQVQVQVQEQKVQLHYLTEAELTPEQKQALVQLDNSQKVEAGDTVYHYVFRPQAVANQLPSTGASDNLVGMIAGASLIVLAVAVSKSKKGRRIVSMTLFTIGAGGVLSSTAIAQEVFANLVEEVTVQVGEAIPTPKAIEGYEFTGYYVREKAPAQPELPAEVAEPTIAEQPTAPVQPVTPEPGQPTTPVQPVVPVTPTSEKGEANKEEKLPEAVVNSREEMAEIPFKEIVKEDADLEAGVEKVIQEGVDGYEKKRIDIITVNNIIVDTHVETLETKDAIDKIIVRGTKVVTPVVPVTPDPVEPVTPVVPEQPTSEKGDANKEEKLPEAVVHSRVEMAEIPFKEIVKEDANLEAGTEKITQEGVNGYEKKRIDIITVDNIKVDAHIEILETKDAIDKIIVRGTKVVTPVTPDPVQPVTPVTPEPEKPTPEVPTNPVGPTSEKGDANKEEKLPEAVVNSRVEMAEIPFKEIVKEDADLEVGTEKVIQEGVNGYEKKRIDIITVDNIKVDAHIEILETKEPIDKIIVRGTKVVTPVVPVTPDPVEPVQPVTPVQPTSEKGDSTKEDERPQAVVSSKEVVEDINFNEVTRDDDQLEEGTVKVIQEGEKGYTKKRIDTITVDGQVVDTREVIVETKEAKDKITVKGTKKVEPVTPTNPTTSGHVIKLSKKYGSSNLGNPTWEYVNSLPNSEKEKLTLITPDYKEDPEARKEVVKLSRELFNYKAFNESFLKLINAERAAKGVNPLQLDENLIYGAQIRANEQADIAQSLRSNGKAHVRPNGQHYTYIRNDISKINPGWDSNLFSFGENMLEAGTYAKDVAKILNYDLVAQNMFNQWKASKGHYANMINKDFTHFGLGVSQTISSKTQDSNSAAPSTIGVTLFGEFGEINWDEE